MKKSNLSLTPFLMKNILFILFGFLSFGSQAAEVTKVAYLEKSDIVTNNSLSLKDDLYAEELASPSMYAAKRRHQVKLSYTRDKRTDLNATWSFTVNYKIYGTATPGTFETGTLQINYTPGSSTAVYESVKEHVGVGSSAGFGYGDVTVMLTPAPVATGTVPSDVRLELVTITERYTNLNTIAPPSIYFTAATSELSWSYVPGAEEYDAEYTFIDDKESIVPTDPFTFADPVRITTSNQYIKIDPVFPKGKLYFRVRAVGRHIVNTGTDYTHVNVSNWSYGNSGTPALSYTIITSFEGSKNWSYSSAYAEEAKSKSGISYIDGNGKARQSQVSMNSDNTTIVEESKYDIEGRPVIDILPVPVTNGVVTDVFKYKSRFNPETSGDEFDHTSFETDAIKELGPSSGAGKYYASTPTAVDEAKFTASAEGFPYSRTVYTADNTGRISQITSGVGATHRIGGGHEINYYYNTTNGTELHRLFGTNVGPASHYKKNYVKDANGQVSVSYLDQENRVIATALAGAAPGNLQPLDENVSQTITVPLNENRVFDENNHSYSQTNKFQNNGSATYTFGYDMKGVIYSTTIHSDGVDVPIDNTHVSEGCVPDGDVVICADCQYKLSIRITDPDGLPVTIPDGSTNVTELTRTFSNPDNPNCVNNQYSPAGITFAVTFNKVGEYTVSKTLSLDDTYLNQEVDAALAENGPTELQKQIINNCYDNGTDFTICDVSCNQECATSVQYEHPGWLSTDAAFIAAVAECVKTTCGQKITDEIPKIFASECDQMLDILKEEVQPGGFEFVQNNPLNADQTDVNFWTRVSNLMNAYTGSNPTPAQLADRQYIIFLSSTGAVLNGSSFLTSIKDPANWTDATKQQWASQLVKADRDYCHYENCIKMEASRAYDVKVAAVTDWNTAKTLGYLDPLGQGSGSLPSGYIGFPPNMGTASSSVANYVQVNYVASGVDPIFATPSGTVTSCVNGNSGSVGFAGCNAFNDMVISLSGNDGKTMFNNGVFNGTLGNYTDIWHFVGIPNSTLYANPTMAIPYTDNNKWSFFRNYYLYVKQQWEDKSLSNGYCNCCPYYTDSKIRPHIKVKEDTQEGYDVANDCGDKCEMNVIYWMDELKTNCSGWASLSAADKDVIKLNLLQYCQSKCGATNPGGLILDAYLTTPMDPYLAAIKTKLDLVSCSAALTALSAGAPYDQVCKTDLTTPVKANKVTACFEQLVKFVNDLPSKADNCYSLNSASYPLLQGGCFEGDHLQLNGTGLMVSNSATCSPSSCGSHVLRFYASNGAVISLSSIVSITLPRHTLTSPLSNITGQFKNIQCVVNSTQIDPATSLQLGPMLAYVYEETPSGCKPYRLTETRVSPCFTELLKYVSDLPSKTTGCYAFNSSYPLIQSGCMGGDHVGLSNYGIIIGGTLCATPSGCNNHYMGFYKENGTLIDATSILSIASAEYVSSSPLSLINLQGVEANYTKVQCMVTTSAGTVKAYIYEALPTDCTPYPVLETPVLPEPVCVANPVDHGPITTTKTDDQLKQDCIDHLLAINKERAQADYDRLVKKFKEDYIKAHYSNCFSSLQVENFKCTYPLSEYHYTLYYYDQAGNLVQTVPPEGVHPVPAAGFDANGNYLGTLEPDHKYLTRYTYGQWNKVKSQETPDGGLTTYSYDGMGRLVGSQTARQKEHFVNSIIGDWGSYTVYDENNRVKEIGEIRDYGIPYDITEMIYDVPNKLGDPIDFLSYFTDGQQKFLRNRVAAVIRHENNYYGPGNSMHYSYDEHGNVKELLQVNDDLSLSGTLSDNSFKKMQYNYDLISGNVKELAYQKGKADQFYHRYRYDADNRLKIAMTSNNGITWEKDAKYFYYKHGALSRTELGEDKVQGVDNAYTINGWLKGINASTLNPSKEMGSDGNSGNKNNYVGKDALAYGLSYYANDYTSVATTEWQANTSSAPIFSLYNGNITWTSNAFMDINEAGVVTMGKSYLYDQLNRLKSAGAYTYTSGSNDLVLANNSFTGVIGVGYSEAFWYDQNGNIKSLRRFDQNGTMMDDLTYKYKNTANTESSFTVNTNQLTRVQDAATTSYTDDIKNQTNTQNYRYDGSGNLQRDEAEGIDEIKWDAYGKVTNIIRIPGFSKIVNGNTVYPSNLEFKYDGFGRRICKIEKPCDDNGELKEENWIYTYYVLDAQGNDMAVYNRKLDLVGAIVKDKFTLKEHHLFGSTRLGIETKNINLGEMDFAYTSYTNGEFDRAETGTIVSGDAVPQPSRMVGDKLYELNNHLGNVYVTVSDKKLGVDADNAGIEKQAENYTANVISSQDYYVFGAMMQGRKFSGSTGYRYAFGGKEKNDELNGEGNSYDFGARIYDPRLGRWLAVDPQAEKYTSYSPYHAMYCNPIAVKDDDGEENIVVVGNQGGSPDSDKNSWYKGGGYRYGENKKHFLQKGLVEAVRLKNYNTENNEETTMLVYEGDYTKGELDMYEAIAKKAGVNFIRCQTAAEIKDYINRSGGYAHNQPSPNGRGDDLITDFSYIGHGLWNSFLVGHDYNDINANISGNDLSPDAFSNDCNANLFGCGNGLDMADYFRDHLVGGNIYGYRTTAIWGQNGLGSVAPHTQEYTRPGIERYSPTRKDLPEADRYRNEKGRAGKDGNVNGEKAKKREPQPSVGGGGREPKN
jgi:RHS repeat-associated protein